jgi:hypothetical protein
LAGEVESDEIPGAAEGDQAMRFDPTLAAHLVPGGVDEVETFAVTAGLGDGDERARVYAHRRRPPRRRLGRGPQRTDSSTELLGHHLDDLSQGANRRLGRPRDRALGGGEQADCYGHRLLVIDDQWR